MRSDRNEKMSGMNRKTYLRDVNPYLICPLCRGYLIDATTVVECLHSFCRSCIVKHLTHEEHCPSCEHVLNNVKPIIKADKALQDIVYKLVPGLYHEEMRRRKEYYTKHPEAAESATPEQRGEDAAGSRLFFAPEDAFSLSLEFLPPGVDPIYDDTTAPTDSESKNSKVGGANRRYLQCPALVTIAHLKKFLALKYNVDITRYNIDISHRRAPLPEYLTLMDVAYIYAWKRNAPMRFFYMITKEEQQLEAPPNDRPSTPGLGACFPPENDREITIPAGENVIPNGEVKHSEPVKMESSAESKKENEPTREGLEKATKKDEKEDKVTREPPAKVKLLKEKGAEGLVNKIKSPIKILKNSDGSYEVKTSQNQQAESKVEQTEFSIVSIKSGSNSNGVKMTLKQLSPGAGEPKKPKVISNVLLRSPGDKPMSIVEQIKEANKTTNLPSQNENVKPLDVKDKTVVKAPEKIKRKVSFVDSSSEPGAKKPKLMDEQKIKKEFLQSFELTATEDCKNRPAESKPNAKVAAKVANLPGSKEGLQDIKKMKETASASSPVNVPPKINASVANKSMDVYNFSSESPPIAGAVKRKCPPGLVITDMTKKFTPEIPRKPNLINTPKSYRKMMKETKILPKQPVNQMKPPMSIAATRNLLDGCGLNIPAGLSITLATSKPSATYTSDTSPTMKMCIKSSDKLNQSIVELHKPPTKASFARSPAPGMIPISQEIATKNQSGKAGKSESQDVLDLGNNRGPEFAAPKVHRLPKVPLPVIKPRPPNQSNLVKKGQVVTLTGGQKFYRAPPGSLTPAAHRVTEFGAPSGGRAPVYAPSMLSPTSNNLSSNFPTLQSLFAQYQQSRLKYTPQESPKTHLVTQCPPSKSTRTTLVVPKQPSNGHLYIKKVQAGDTRATKHVTFDRPSDAQVPTSSATSPQPSETSSPTSDRSANSPRVSSTVSPSPPPSEPAAENKTSEKSPESPDSSSVVEKKEEKKESAQEKNDQKVTEEPLKRMPSPNISAVSKEHLDNLIKNLKSRIENQELKKDEEKKEEATKKEA